MSDQLNHDPAGTAPASAPEKKPRRWPRRVFISLMVVVLLLGGAFWLLGRESTLQQLVQRVASASGGNIAVTGVTGSLYHRMHIDRLVYKTKDRTVTAQSIDINWSPLQYFSEGLQISELHVASLTVRSTGKSDEPTTMPNSLASPFRLSLSDARLDQLVLASDTGATVIDNLRFALYGDKTSWHLQDASARTPFGLAKADLTIAGARPFALQGTASLTQALVATPAAAGTAATPVGQAPTPAQLTLQAGGSLALLELKAKGDAGAATGTAALSLAPFDPVILRAIDLVARDVDPHGFDAGLPAAKFNLKVKAAIAPDQKLAGEFELLNQGKAGPLDQDLLPLDVFRGRLGGTLTASTLDNVLLDLGPAGRFNGAGKVDRKAIDAGIDTASFKLHTDRLDLSLLHGSANQTAIGGDIIVASTATRQTLKAALADKGLRLDADATLADALLQLQQLRLVAKNGSITASGQLSLKDQQAFSAKVRTQRFDPSALVPGYPVGDLNIDVNAAGKLVPAWKVAADFDIKPSKLVGQPLTGAGKLNADSTHISGVDARLAMGQNTAAVAGNFGAPGEQLRWKVDARQLAAVSPDLIGAIDATGVVTGTMQSPRSSFEADARGLGLASAKRPAADSVIHASGDVAMAGAEKTPELKMTGTVQRLNPAAFGAAQAGAINAAFTADARLSADWRAGLNLTLQPSTLSNAPLSGYAKLSANARDISNADIDLRLGANSLIAKGSFGSAMDKLDWKLDAPQLAALGPQFAGILHANGTLSGTTARPAISLNLDGSKLRAPGQQQVESIRGSATLGSTAAAPAAPNGNRSTGSRAAPASADVPLISDITIAGYESPSIKIAKARLQTAGTRSAHTITLAANNSDFDATVRIKGGWANDTWTGAIDALQNKGRFALALVAPAPLRLAAPAGSGVAGLARPEQIALGTTTIKIRDGSVRIDSLEKNGTAWRSKGQASALPVWYLGQLSDAWRDSVRGNMTIGADWGVNLQAAATGAGKGAAPVLAGSFHVFREQGDVTIIGADLSQPLGLKTLDARATVNNGALRVELNVDGTRVGQARLDGTAQLRDGRLANDSPFTVTGNANMGSLAWLAPLAGQPGLEIDGILKLALEGSGTIGAPQLSGDINGQKLVVNLPDQGIKLRNGVLQARLTGDQLQLQTLSFEGQQGRAQADGWIRYAGNEATMQLKLSADKLEVLSRPDRLLVVSGQSTLVRDAKRFQLDGKFRADRANIELGDENAPTLSNDVVVLGKGAPAPATKPAQGLPLNIDVEADLGDAFKLKGMGIETELAGAVRVRITDRRPPRVNGSIRVVGGTYAAYGQKLAIDRGVINFTGAYDNPGLNIVAVRRRPEGEPLTETNVEAGVEVRGTALAPSAKLISTPTVPDSDKLSWLVLGHGIENTEGNDMALLSTAAGALFGGKGQGKLANSLGLDELGVGQASGTAAGAGAATGLQNTVVTVGKRISSRAYLSFEQGAGTATSLVKLKYKLNPRISLQFQTGTNNALDILYSWAFD